MVGWLDGFSFITVGGVPRAQKMLKGNLPKSHISPSIIVYEEEILISRPYLSLKSRRVPRASVGPRSKLPRFTFQTQSKVVAQLTLLVAITV